MDFKIKITYTAKRDNMAWKQEAYQPHKEITVEPWEIAGQPLKTNKNIFLYTKYGSPCKQICPIAYEIIKEVK